MPLHPDVALSVHLDAICGRNQYTRHPDPVVDEIRVVAGGRVQLRDETIGQWVGYFRSEPTATLCDALTAAFPGARVHVPEGARRRGGAHSSTGYGQP